MTANESSPPLSFRGGRPQSVDYQHVSRSTSPDPKSNEIEPDVKPKYWDFLEDTWAPEIAGLVVSIGSLVGLYVFLTIYDGRPLLQMPWGITPNAVISTLITISKSSLLLAITSAMGQLKWHWFRNGSENGGRSLLDAQLFDEASRGPWGSLVFLSRRHTWSLGSIGAVITLIAIAVDPFSQQLISYEMRDIPITSNGTNWFVPSIPVAKGLDGDISDDDFNAGLKSILNMAIWGPSDERAEFTPQPHCPASNCTWEPQQTLAFCSSCEDRTSDLSLDECSLAFKYLDIPDDNYTFPCTIRFATNDLLKYTTNVSVTYTVSNESFSANFSYASDIYWPLQDDVTLGGSYQSDCESFTSDDPNGSKINSTGAPFMKLGQARLQFDPVRPDRLSVMSAQVCTMTPCAKELSVSVTNGVGDSRMSDANLGALSPNFSNPFFNYHPYSQFCQLFDIQTSFWSLEPIWNGALNIPLRDDWQPAWDGTLPPPPNWSFFVSSRALAGIQSTLFSSILGSRREHANYRYNNTEMYRSDKPVDLSRNETEFRSESASEVSDRISKQGGLPWMTRRYADALTRFAHDVSDVTVAGQASYSETHVVVSWAWLSLPAVVVLGGMVFLVLTMVVSYWDKHALWKGSILPFMFRGPDRWEFVTDVPYEPEMAEKISGMDEMARVMNVRLRREGDGRGLRLSID